MLVLFPYTGQRKIIYGLSTDFKLILRLIIKNEKSKLLDIIPENVGDNLPIINNYSLAGNFECFLAQSRNKIRFRSARWLRNWILSNMKNEIIEIPYKRKPKNIFKPISESCKWVTRYYVLTKEKLYCRGFEPDNIFCRKFIINRNIVLVIS